MRYWKLKRLGKNMESNRIQGSGIGLGQWSRVQYSWYWYWPVVLILASGIKIGQWYWNWTVVLKLDSGFEIGRWVWNWKVGFILGLWFWNWRVKLGIEGEDLKLNCGLEIKLGLEISDVVCFGSQIPPFQRICQWNQISTPGWNIALSDAVLLEQHQMHRSRQQESMSFCFVQW
jgi:hypothetical protein